jgi:hypothetical protein
MKAFYIKPGLKLRTGTWTDLRRAANLPGQHLHQTQAKRRGLPPVQFRRQADAVISHPQAGNGGVKMKRVADKKCDTSLVFIDLPYACQVALPDRLKSIDQNQRLMIYVVCLPGG